MSVHGIQLQQNFLVVLLEIACVDWACCVLNFLLSELIIGWKHSTV